MLALSDGVFAIVATLLVLELKVPEPANRLSSSGREQALWLALRDLWPKLGLYFLTFFLVGGNWLSHSELTRRLARGDTQFGRHNLTYLMLVSPQPFSAALVGAYGDTRPAWWVYCLNQILISASFLRLWAEARRHGLMSLEHQAARPEGEVRALSSLMVFGLSAILAWRSLSWGYLALALFVPLAWLRRRERA